MLRQVSVFSWLQRCLLVGVVCIIASVSFAEESTASGIVERVHDGSGSVFIDDVSFQVPNSVGLNGREVSRGVLLSAVKPGELVRYSFVIDDDGDFKLLSVRQVNQ